MFTGEEEEMIERASTLTPGTADADDARVVNLLIRTAAALAELMRETHDEESRLREVASEYVNYSWHPAFVAVENAHRHVSGMIHDYLVARPVKITAEQIGGA